MKIAIALVIAFAIGFSSGWFEIPAPAPPTLNGAALEMAMSIGYMSGSKARAAAAPTAMAVVRKHDQL